MVRVVLDTVVFVRALINPRSICGRLAFDFPTLYQPITSPAILRELLEVLNRPEIRAKSGVFHRVSLERTLALMARAEVVEPEDSISACRDPEDDKFLQAAVSGKAQYIVSEDNDLLALGEYAGINIVTARSFIRLIEASKQ